MMKRHILKAQWAYSAKREVIMRIRVFLVLTLLLFSATTMGLGDVYGAEYPSKTIEILCSFTPGSTLDALARLVAEVGQKYAGQPMVVVNKPGAGGSIAAAEILSSKPDGYKLIVLGNLFRAGVVKTQKVPFDPDDLAPLVNFLELRQGLVVGADRPWKTLSDVIAYAKKNPGQFKWGHAGRGTGVHFVVFYIFKTVGVQTTEVPFKGAAENITAILGGHVDAMTTSYSPVKDHMRAGKLRCLTFFSDRRFPDQPDIPSVVELGFPDACKLATYVGVYAHRNTPENIKSYLVGVLKKIYDDPRFRKGVQDLGEDLKYGNPEWVMDSIRKAEEITVPILKEVGLYVGK
jgi:tripartite-type tricarboxylate transporter receptor subunit TctC